MEYGQIMGSKRILFKAVVPRFSQKECNGLSQVPRRINIFSRSAGKYYQGPAGTGRDWQGLAGTGRDDRDWQGLAETGRDWQRLPITGWDWQRLPRTDRD